MNLILFVGAVVCASILIVALINTYNVIRLFELRGAGSACIPDIYGNVGRSVGLLHGNGENTIYAEQGEKLQLDGDGNMIPKKTVFVTSVNSDVLIGR